MNCNRCDIRGQLYLQVFALAAVLQGFADVSGFNGPAVSGWTIVRATLTDRMWARTDSSKRFDATSSSVLASALTLASCLISALVISLFSFWRLLCNAWPARFDGFMLLIPQRYRYNTASSGTGMRVMFGTSWACRKLASGIKKVVILLVRPANSLPMMPRTGLTITF
jgi:hypothetical protein